MDQHLLVIRKWFRWILKSAKPSKTHLFVCYISKSNLRQLISVHDYTSAVDAWVEPGVGVTKAPLISPQAKYWISQKHLLDYLNYIYIWLVPLHLTCGDTYQIEKWYSIDNVTCCFYFDLIIGNNFIIHRVGGSLPVATPGKYEGHYPA